MERATNLFYSRKKPNKEIQENINTKKNSTEYTDNQFCLNNQLPEIIAELFRYLSYKEITLLSLTSKTQISKKEKALDILKEKDTLIKFLKEIDQRLEPEITKLVRFPLILAEKARLENELNNTKGLVSLFKDEWIRPDNAAINKAMGKYSPLASFDEDKSNIKAESMAALKHISRILFIIIITLAYLTAINKIFKDPDTRSNFASAGFVLIGLGMIYSVFSSSPNPTNEASTKLLFANSVHPFGADKSIQDKHNMKVKSLGQARNMLFKKYQNASNDNFSNSNVSEPDLMLEAVNLPKPLPEEFNVYYQRVSTPRI